MEYAFRWTDMSSWKQSGIWLSLNWCESFLETKWNMTFIELMWVLLGNKLNMTFIELMWVLLGNKVEYDSLNWCESFLETNWNMTFTELIWILLGNSGIQFSLKSSKVWSVPISSYNTSWFILNFQGNFLQFRYNVKQYFINCACHLLI